MRTPSLIGPALLVAAVLSTSALPPAEHLRIVPAGSGHSGSPRPADQLPLLAGQVAPTGVAIAGRRVGTAPRRRPCTDPLAGPSLRLLTGGEPGSCKWPSATG